MRSLSTPRKRPADSQAEEGATPKRTVSSLLQDTPPWVTPPSDFHDVTQPVNADEEEERIPVLPTDAQAAPASVPVGDDDDDALNVPVPLSEDETPVPHAPETPCGDPIDVIPQMVTPPSDDQDVIPVPTTSSNVTPSPAPTASEVVSPAFATGVLDMTYEHIPRPSETIYHTDTILQDGRYTILVDSGAVSNICGSEWAQAVAKQAKARGQRPYCKKRQSVLGVSGVGEGVQRCGYDSILPLDLAQSNGKVTTSTFTAATVPNSGLPALMGLQSLLANRCILDLVNLKMYFCGPSEVDLQKGIPEGSETYDLKITPSGHLALPFREGSVPPEMSSRSFPVKEDASVEEAETPSSTETPQE